MALGAAEVAAGIPRPVAGDSRERRLERCRGPGGSLGLGRQSGKCSSTVGGGLSPALGRTQSPSWWQLTQEPGVRGSSLTEMEIWEQEGACSPEVGEIPELTEAALWRD